MSNHADPLAYIHQTAVHQLRHAADEIEKTGGGIVTGFDYDEDVMEETAPGGPIMTSREVTVELTYLLPE